MELFVVTWHENHPDKMTGVLGVFDSQEEADKAIEYANKRDREETASRGLENYEKFYHATSYCNLNAVYLP